MNEGINISGNSRFSADQVAVGRNSRAVKFETLDPKGKDYESVYEKMDELIKLLSSHKDEIHNSPELISNVSTVSEELKKDRPNADAIKSVLSEITESVSSVSRIAEAVAALKSAILLIL